MMVVFPKVLVMIPSEMWSDSEKFLEESVSRLIERLYIRCEKKRKVNNEQPWIIMVPFT